jgi:hypothetical protein
MKGIRDFESKGGCPGKHTLSYGSYSEHQEALELEKAVQETDPLPKLEQEWEKEKSQTNKENHE